VERRGGDLYRPGQAPGAGGAVGQPRRAHHDRPDGEQAGRRGPWQRAGPGRADQRQPRHSQSAPHSGPGRGTSPFLQPGDRHAPAGESALAAVVHPARAGLSARTHDPGHGQRHPPATERVQWLSLSRPAGKGPISSLTAWRRS